MSIGPGGKLTVTGKADLGAVAEGVAYSPSGEYLYVANFLEKTCKCFGLTDGRPAQIARPLKLPGQPASMRGPAR